MKDVTLVGLQSGWEIKKWMSFFNEYLIVIGSTMLLVVIVSSLILVNMTLIWVLKMPAYKHRNKLSAVLQCINFENILFYKTMIIYLNFYFSLSPKIEKDNFYRIS